MHDQTSFRISKTMLKLILSLIFIHQVSSLECKCNQDVFVECIKGLDYCKEGFNQCKSVDNVAKGCKKPELYYIPFDYCKLTKFKDAKPEQCECVCQEDDCNSNVQLECKANVSGQLSFRIQYHQQIGYFTPVLKTEESKFFGYMEANFNGVFERDDQLQNDSYIDTKHKVKPRKDGETLTCIDNSSLPKGEKVKNEANCKKNENVCIVESNTITKYVFRYENTLMIVIYILLALSKNTYF